MSERRGHVPVRGEGHRGGGAEEITQKFHARPSVLAGTLVSNAHVSQFQPTGSSAPSKQQRHGFFFFIKTGSEGQRRWRPLLRAPPPGRRRLFCCSATWTNPNRSRPRHGVLRMTAHGRIGDPLISKSDQQRWIILPRRQNPRLAPPPSQPRRRSSLNKSVVMTTAAAVCRLQANAGVRGGAEDARGRSRNYRELPTLARNVGSTEPAVDDASAEQTLASPEDQTHQRAPGPPEQLYLKTR